MPAYAVKHLVADHGPLSKVMKEVRRTPYSYTSKEPEATEASLKGDIYVFEVRVHKAERTYALGYKYRATEKFAPAGGGLWKDEFKFRNSSTPGDPPIGVYFDPPLEIGNSTITSWLSGKQPGMAAIPALVLTELETLVSAPTSGATSF